MVLGGCNFVVFLPSNFDFDGNTSFVTGWMISGTCPKQ